MHARTPSDPDVHFCSVAVKSNKFLSADATEEPDWAALTAQPSNETEAIISEEHQRLSVRYIFNLIILTRADTQCL